MIRTLLVLSLLVLASNGCTPERREKPVVVQARPASVRGTIVYRERMALPDDAVVELRLVELSRRGEPQTLATRIIKRPGQAPIRFELDYDPRKIDERAQYGVEAEIRIDNRTVFSNAADCPVITRGNPDRVEIMLHRQARRR